MEKGEYNILLGTSSRKTVCIADAVLDEEILVRSVNADIGLNDANKGKIDFLRQKSPRMAEKDGEIPKLHISGADFSKIGRYTKNMIFQFRHRCLRYRMSARGVFPWKGS